MLQDFSKYPNIYRYSNLEGIDPDTLAKAYLLEEKYHKLLLAEQNHRVRIKLYDDFYSQLIPLYGRNEVDISAHNPKAKYVRLFAKELMGKSIVDYGCGQGHMLVAIDSALKVKSLTGIDVTIPKKLLNHERIQFIESNIMDHKFDDPFEVALSDNVLEHLVPEDAQIHLNNIHQNLESNGKLIIIMPNKLFGPWDITRIKDFSQSGKTEAQGGHVNESSHHEMIANLKKAGFEKFQTIFPIPKLKYSLFKNLRLKTNWIENIERSQKTLSLIKTVKYKGVCLLKFPVVLIAKK